MDRFAPKIDQVYNVYVNIYFCIGKHWGDGKYIIITPSSHKTFIYIPLYVVNIYKSL